MRVLVLEDNVDLNIEIKRYLSIKNFDVLCVEDGEDAISHISTKKFDLYIIDIYVPNISGLEVLKFIRKIDLLTPVIIITASLEISNLTLAYEYGCSEYIKKPFDIKELDVRMGRLLNYNLDCITFCDKLEYQREKNIFILDGKILEFRKKEKRLLEILINNINKTVAQDIIIDYVWEHEIKDSYSLRQLVNGIRKKLPSHVIKTDIGVGYALINNKTL